MKPYGTRLRKVAFLLDSLSCRMSITTKDEHLKNGE